MAKTVDVDGMLRSMTPTQFAEWCAKDQIEPIGHSGHHQILARIGVLIAAGLKADLDEHHFLPWIKVEEPVQVLNPEQSAQVLNQYISTKASG